MSIAKGVALVTGSAQGIGRAIALRLAEDGFDIALNDVPSKLDQLRTVEDDIQKIGRKTHLVPADVTIEDEVSGMVQGVTKELGGLDVMVANAGIGTVSSVVDTELDDWERVMAVNARGPFLCYKYAAQHMIKQGRGGRIIGASSILGGMGLQGCSAYCASKFAIRGLTQTAALELGRYNITVNCYAPGFIETAMTAAVFSDEPQSQMIELMRSLIAGKPIKHNAGPEDIASIVSYLASKEAHFITGQSITVDGGTSLS